MSARSPRLPAALGAAAGLVLDRLLPEPAGALHPVALFGVAMAGLEKHLHRDARGAGVAHACAGLALGIGAGRLVRSTTAATTSAVAGRALGEAATAVGTALEQADLTAARQLLPALVGRDPDGLDESEITRAVVESVAENTVDGVVAPAFWASIAGAPGALGYRAVNTLDSMVGYRSARYRNYGWASARLDDVLGWVPARLTALLVAVVRPSAAAAVWTAVRTQAGAHPSPNAGVAEAAFAAALGLRLGGANRYGDRLEHRAPLGDGEPPEVGDIRRAVRLSEHVSLAFAAVLATIGVLLAGWRRRPAGVAR